MSIDRASRRFRLRHRSGPAFVRDRSGCRLDRQRATARQSAGEPTHCGLPTSCARRLSDAVDPAALLLAQGWTPRQDARPCPRSQTPIAERPCRKPAADLVGARGEPFHRPRVKHSGPSPEAYISTSSPRKRLTILCGDYNAEPDAHASVPQRAQEKRLTPSEPWPREPLSCPTPDLAEMTGAML